MSTLSKSQSIILQAQGSLAGTDTFSNVVLAMCWRNVSHKPGSYLLLGRLDVHVHVGCVCRTEFCSCGFLEDTSGRFKNIIRALLYIYNLILLV